MTALLFIILALTSINIEAATSVDQPRQLEAAFNGCHFRLIDHMGGRFRPMMKGFDQNAYYTISSETPKYRRLSPAISFRCENKAGEEKFSDMGVFRKDNLWHIKPNVDDPDNIGNAKIYSLDGEKNIGVAMTDDQTTGDLEERNRGLLFCLTNHEQMLCGSSEVIARVADPKTSVLSEVLEMLKSIEFLDPVEGAFTRP